MKLTGLMTNKRRALVSWRNVSTGIYKKSVLQYQTTRRHIPVKSCRRCSWGNWIHNFSPESCVLRFV